MFQPAAEHILWDVVRRHLEEAEFVLELWEQALDAPDYTLAELAAGPELRLLAHVDALVVGGPCVEQRLLAPLIHDVRAHYSERVSVAVLACQTPDIALEALARVSDPEHVRGLVRGLELRDDPQLDARLLDMLSVPSTPSAGLLELLARRRVALAPWPGRMRELMENDELAASLARLARWSPDPCSLDQLDVLARSNDPTVRAAALDTALLRGVQGAWESMVYWAFTERESTGRKRALEWVACLGDASARARVSQLIDQPEHRASALWASGFGGSTAAIERSLPLLEDEELGPLAAELVSAIAGLGVDDEHAWLDPTTASQPEQSLPPLALDDLDAELVDSPESLLPKPNAEAIRVWWREQAANFTPEQRYLGGRALSPAGLLHALEHAPLRRRHVLARELAVRSQGALHVPTRSFARVQLRSLRGLSSQPQWGTLDLRMGRRAR